MAKTTSMALKQASLIPSNTKITMIKSALAAVAAAPFFASAALAGPYANIEANSGFTGTEYSGTVTEFHVGFEDELGENSAWYIQAGPALVSPDGGDSETELSGKVGVGTNLTESLNLYGEIAFITDGDEDNSYGTKVGVKYNF